MLDKGERLSWFQIGDEVEWESSSGGYAKFKRGIVVAVVPANAFPHKHCPPQFKLINPGGPRPVESYLVRVGSRSKLYWPRVRQLQKSKQGLLAHVTYL